MLKADFHIHTDYSPDSSVSPKSLVARCVKQGINCIAVTDHDTIQGALAVARIAPFRVIIGSEIKSADGEIIGLFLKEDVPPKLLALETVRRIKQQGGLVSLPHPFDRFRHHVLTPKGLDEALPYADMVEGLNARNMASADNRKALELATKRGLPAVGVTDCHSIIEVGRAFTELPDFDGTAEGFKKALAQAKIGGRPSHSLVHTISTYNKFKKRLLNAIGIRRGR